MKIDPRTAFAAMFAIFSLTAACSKPKLGAACTKEGATSCVNDTSALICVDSKWESKACTSVTGCMSMGINEGKCTSDGNAVGEPCPDDEGNPSCSTDKKAMLKCTKKHWVKVDDCSGSRGCVSNADGANCDKGTAAEGEACTKSNEGNAACSPDKTKLLVCKGGKMVASSYCKGQNGCREQGDQINCDDSLAAVGDPCDEEGEAACSMEKKDFLRCKGGKFTKEKSCSQCTPFLDNIQCD
jgi:hypothetical protein